MDENLALQFFRKKGNLMSHLLTYLLLTTILGLNVSGTEFGLASRQYVDSAVTDAKGEFADLKDQVADNSDKLDRSLEIQLSEQIDKILRFKCMNPGDDSLDDNLRDREAEYRKLTGTQYRRPSCEYLVDSR